MACASPLLFQVRMPGAPRVALLLLRPSRLPGQDPRILRQNTGCLILRSFACNAVSNAAQCASIAWVMRWRSNSACLAASSAWRRRSCSARRFVNAPVWPRQGVLPPPPVPGSRGTVHESSPGNRRPCQTRPAPPLSRTTPYNSLSPAPSPVSHPGAPVLTPIPADSCPRHCSRQDWLNAPPPGWPRRRPVIACHFSLLPQTGAGSFVTGCSSRWPCLTAGVSSALASASPVSPVSTSCGVSPATSTPPFSNNSGYSCQPQPTAYAQQSHYHHCQRHTGPASSRYVLVVVLLVWSCRMLFVQTSLDSSCGHLRPGPLTPGFHTLRPVTPHPPPLPSLWLPAAWNCIYPCLPLQRGVIRCFLPGYAPASSPPHRVTHCPPSR